MLTFNAGKKFSYTPFDPSRMIDDETSSFDTKHPNYHEIFKLLKLEFDELLNRMDYTVDRRKILHLPVVIWVCCFSFRSMSLKCLQYILLSWNLTTDEARIACQFLRKYKLLEIHSGRLELTGFGRYQLNRSSFEIRSKYERKVANDIFVKLGAKHELLLDIFNDDQSIYIFIDIISYKVDLYWPGSDLSTLLCGCRSWLKAINSKLQCSKPYEPLETDSKLVSVKKRS